MEAENSSLTKEIHHPAHRHSCPLILFLFRGSSDSPCSLCGKHFKELDPVYSCSDPNCDFKVDVSCSSIRSIIEFEAHRQHPLCFIERAAPGTSCRRCQDERPDLPMFRCGECGFSLHLLCGPLPCAVQYKGYELTLTDSLLPGVDAQDCWCDICEEQRDPAQCVYHSPDIMFTASIDCLLPQIILALKGELGDVELMTVGGHIPGKVIGGFQMEDGVQATKAGKDIYGDEVVQEAESSTEKEEAFASVLPDLGELLEPAPAEASTQLMELLDSELHLRSWTYTEAAIRGFSLDSPQFLRSLNADQADEFKGDLDAMATFVGKSKATGSLPSLDVALQRFKEQLDVSCLREDVQPEKHESGIGDNEVVGARSCTLNYVQVMRCLTPRDIEQINNALRKRTKHGRVEEAILSAFSNFFPLPPPRPREVEFPYSDEFYKLFRELIDDTDLVNDSYLTGWKKYAAKIVKVGNNMIPSQFVPIYQELVDKYGDFSESSELSPIGKAVIFHLFFAVVYSMRETQVRNITDSLLCTWQYYLRSMQNAGFQIQFALDNLEKLFRARCGLLIMEFRDDAKENLEGRVEKLSKWMDRKEAKLEELKSMREKYRKPKEVEKTLVKQCLIEAAKWKWKDFGDLIL